MFRLCVVLFTISYTPLSSALTIPEYNEMKRNGNDRIRLYDYVEGLGNAYE